MRIEQFNGLKIIDGEFIQYFIVCDGGGVPQGTKKEIRKIIDGKLTKTTEEDNF